MKQIKDFNKKVLVPEAKDLLGVTKEVLEQGLKQNKFPFGVGIKMEIQWRYIIYFYPLLDFLGITEKEYEIWKEQQENLKEKEKVS